MPRPSNTARRREEIVRGLLGVMAEHGYERTSVARIAEAAGLTPGLIHYHFDSKQEILLALVERIRRVIRERLERRLSRAGRDPRARLFAYIDAHLALGPDSDPGAMACWVAIGAEALRQPEVRKIYADALAQDLRVLEGLLRDLLSSEGRPARPARAMAAGLLAAIEGAYQLGCAAPGTIPRGSAAPMLKKMAEGLIEGQGRAATSIRR